jgi:hypothetical protein
MGVEKKHLERQRMDQECPFSNSALSKQLQCDTHFQDNPSKLVLRIGIGKRTYLGLRTT